MDYSALISLADKTNARKEEAEFSLPNASNEIKAQIAELVEVDRKAVIKQAAMQIVEVMRSAASVELALVKNIREARAEIAKAKEKLDEIKRAKQYAAETDNYLPLLQKVQPTRSTWFEIANELRCIPTSWVSGADKVVASDKPTGSDTLADNPAI